MDIAGRKDLRGADLKGTDLKGASLEAVFLGEAYGLSPEQLSKVKTLCNAKLDEKLLITLKEKYPVLFEKPD